MGYLFKHSEYLADIEVLSRSLYQTLWSDSEAMHKAQDVSQGFRLPLPGRAKNFLPSSGFVVQRCARAVANVHIRCFEGFRNEPTFAEF